MAGFGDIFAGALMGGSSSPYEARGYRAEEDRIKSSRLAVANAFNDWRAANPEATQQDLAQFLSMATGGDAMAAGPSYSGKTFRDTFDKKSAEAKAKRVIEEGNKQAAENSAWGERITAIYQKNLAASAYNEEIAWQKTQAEVTGLAPDPETRNVFNKRLEGFDYKGFAVADKDEWVTKNLPKIQEVIANGYRNGADDKTINGQLTALGMGRDFSGNPLIGNVFAEAKRGVTEEKQAKALRDAEIARAEEERKQAKETQDREDATRIAQALEGGASKETVRRIYGPKLDELAPQIDAIRNGVWEAKSTQAKAKKPELTEAAQKAQLATIPIALIDKSNPVAGMVVRELANEYALTAGQREAIMSIASDTKMQGKNYDFIKKAVVEKMGGAANLHTFDSFVQKQIDSQGVRGPATFTKKLQAADTAVQNSIAQNQTALGAALKSTYTDKRLESLPQVIANATAALTQVKAIYKEENFDSDFFGDKADGKLVSASAERHAKQLQAIIDKANEALQAAKMESSKPAPKTTRNPMSFGMEPMAPIQIPSPRNPTPRVQRSLSPKEATQRGYIF